MHEATPNQHGEKYLAAICTQSAPFSNAKTQDISEKWQITVHSNNQEIVGYRDRNTFRFLGIRYAPQPERFTHSIMHQGFGERAATLSALGDPARYLVVDGIYLVSDELQVWPQGMLGSNGTNLRVHLMMGITAEDGTSMLIYPRNDTLDNVDWLTAQGFPSPPSSLFPLDDIANATLAMDKMAARLATDALFRCIDQATVYVGLKSDVVGQSVYYYEFDRTYQPPGWPYLDLCEALKTAERPHSDPESPDNNLRCASRELLYMFGNIARRGLPYRDGGDVVFARYTLDTFAAFARTWGPNTGKKFLRSRGYHSTLEALEGTGRWEPAVKGDIRLRRLDWPARGNMIDGFRDMKHCEWLHLPHDY